MGKQSPGHRGWPPNHRHGYDEAQEKRKGAPYCAKIKENPKARGDTHSAEISAAENPIRRVTRAASRSTLPGSSMHEQAESSEDSHTNMKGKGVAITEKRKRGEEELVGHEEDQKAPSFAEAEQWLLNDGKSSSDEKWLNCWLLYAISTLLCPTSATSLCVHGFHVIRDVGNVTRYNWCSLVVERLVKDIKDFKDGKQNFVTGYLFLLMILYLDSIDTRDIVDQTAEIRVSVWTASAVGKAIAMDKLSAKEFGKLHSQEDVKSAFGNFTNAINQAVLNLAKQLCQHPYKPGSSRAVQKISTSERRSKRRHNIDAKVIVEEKSSKEESEDHSDLEGDDHDRSKQARRDQMVLTMTANKKGMTAMRNQRALNTTVNQSDIKCPSAMKTGLGKMLTLDHKNLSIGQQMQQKPIIAGDQVDAAGGVNLQNQQQ
ncbi:hypothetical protein U9M48_024996 [Paspalum notatum var. saurae]|uniref:Uncharacterized protein n=1 Tax=Paspalum notatum var. saurae TaxID=547442 RepID=A0AAQ3WX41_PASNO